MKSVINRYPYILAVDDEKEFLLLFQASLSALGYEVKTSLNGIHLWETIDMKTPDIIFLDIQMCGINGGDLCRQLKENNKTKNIPVILLSGNDDVKELAGYWGAAGFINKPSNTESILKEIRRILS